jgi:anti-sigma B factor antagonist
MSASNRMMEYSIRDVTIVVLQEAAILDPLVIQEIAEALYHTVDGKACRKLVVDFSKVRQLSSTAIGVMINLKKKADAIRGEVVLCGIHRDLLKLFSITHLDKVFVFRPNEKDSLAVFGVTTAG